MFRGNCCKVTLLFTSQCTHVITYNAVQWKNEQCFKFYSLWYPMGKYIHKIHCLQKHTWLILPHRCATKANSPYARVTEPNKLTPELSTPLTNSVYLQLHIEHCLFVLFVKNQKWIMSYDLKCNYLVSTVQSFNTWAPKNSYKCTK